jgi:hypothetical protein
LGRACWGLPVLGYGQQHPGRIDLERAGGRSYFRPIRGVGGNAALRAEGVKMKRPAPEDFDVEVRGGGVEVTFKPTNSHYSFRLLADPEVIDRLGKLDPEPHVRHAGPTNDTDQYSDHEVLAMALGLAREKVR